nr:hypothetical protein [Tanacetum cinerariifolium]
MEMDRLVMFGPISYVNVVHREPMSLMNGGEKGRTSYARVLIEINACNNFSDSLVMVVPCLEGNGYMKETISIKYEWKPHHYSTCLIYGHSLVNYPKVVPKRVGNNMDQGKWQTSRADDEGFIEVKKKKPCSNGGTKNFKSLSVKPKTQYHPKGKQLTEGTSNSPKTTHFVGTNKASTSSYNKESPNNTCSFYSLSNSFEALNVDMRKYQRVVRLLPRVHKRRDKVLPI